MQAPGPAPGDATRLPFTIGHENAGWDLPANVLDDCSTSSDIRVRGTRVMSRAESEDSGGVLTEAIKKG